MKEEVKKRVLKHIDNIKFVFNLKGYNSEYDKLLLARKLRAIETEAHHKSEDYCNGVIDTEDTLVKTGEIKRGIDFYLNRLKDRLNNLLHYKEQNIPVFINTDPRGYALKIKDDYVRGNNINIYTDFGGYGIIAPDLKEGW